MNEPVTVGIADCKLARGKQMLMTRDLGSCIAVCLRDPKSGIGGLLHVMLADAPAHIAESQIYKYADTGIEKMIFQMRIMGADCSGLVAKIAGGAHIIRTPGIPETEDVSSRNLNAVCRKLQEKSIPIVAKEVGDDFPRTVFFEPESGVVQIKTAGMSDRYI